MNNKILLAFHVLFFSAIALYGQTPAAKPRYNVLFIAADDLRPELGCYGVTAIQTPNIDKIAARGTRFDNAYAQFPVCNPSRASLLTGRYPTQNGVMGNSEYFRTDHPELITLPQYFKNNGYVSLRSGKIFHGGIDDAISWTEGGEPVNPAMLNRGAQAPRPAVTTPAPTRPAARPGRPNPGSDTIIVLEGNGEKHGDYQTATRAIAYMEKYKNQPFFMGVGFVKPHSPPTAPQKFFDLYDVNKMELPVDFGTTPKALPDAPAISISPTNADLFIGRPSTPELSREMKRAYYASTSFMDAQVGRVMDALKKNGLEDNTIVVFFGDHGYHLGEKGKWSKAYSLYELGLRVPLIVAIPKGKGEHSNQVVQLLDLYPTLAELCGLPIPAGQEGHSFTPQLKDPAANRDFPAYAVVDFRGKIGKSVRTKRWHYVEWDEGTAGKMLYEHPNDPKELKNLAEKPEYVKEVQEMKRLLKLMPDTRKK